MRVLSVKLDAVVVRFGGEIGVKSEWTRKTLRLLTKNVVATSSESISLTIP